MTTASATRPARTPDNAIRAALKKYWGYDNLRPLQREAIEAGLSQNDSLVVLPTGGGKSLCYQIPPLVAGRTDVVVSPLISLMKDQVDALNANGYPAAALHSGLTDYDRRQVEAHLLDGKYRLLFVAPERLLTQRFIDLLKRIDVRGFAIDEAHCISQWGHDFRPEYRKLAVLKKAFPQASFHAFTATATPKVRQDIIEQLKLKSPRVLVGNFDRPNLIYRVVPRRSLDQQVYDTVQNHAKEAVIVYCLSRNDTERMAGSLRERGVKAAAYHAGLDNATRARTQEDFAKERVDVVVATVAFGMGIDRSNVRCVIHATMPKSIEHYQQETGRAGRDGLEAECVLFYSPGDYRRWEGLLTRSAAEVEPAQPEEVTKAQLALLDGMDRFCTSQDCRHRSLVRYFGQDYAPGNCGACDICLSDEPALEGSDEIARTIVSCITRLGMPYGVGYVVEVLTGARSERIEQRRHNQLVEYGTLQRLPREAVQSFVYQLVDLGILERTAGDRPVLQLLTPARDVLLGRLDVSLRLPTITAAPAKLDAPLTEKERGLFEKLREERRRAAEEAGVPPFVVFSDATLQELARSRPSTLDAFGRVKGVGERKRATFGERFLAVVVSYCRDEGMTADIALKKVVTPPKVHNTAATSDSKRHAFSLFARGKSIDEVTAVTGRARATVASYLEDFVAETRPPSIDAWIAPALYERIEKAAKQTGGSFLRPVFEALNGEVAYDDIRVVMRHLGVR